MTPESDFVGREPCPSCGSRDNLARYSDGHGYCFGCHHYEPGEGEPPQQIERKNTVADFVETGEFKELRKRKLTAKTARRWGYHVNTYAGRTAQIADYRDETNTLVAQKVRFENKDFRFLNGSKEYLFGRHLWRDKGRRIIVTEGEIDAMTVDQAMQHKWPVVSLPNGAAAAKASLAANLEWLNGFEEVVLCFDQDEPGQAAVKECCGLFPPGKLRIASLPRKDPSDMVQNDQLDELIRCLWEAKEYRPDGLVTLADLRDRVLREPDEGLPWFLPRLSGATYGRRYGEAVALGAGTGVGKTTFITQQIAFDIFDLGLRVGVFALEQHPSETAKRVLGQATKKTFHIPRSGWTQEELTGAFDNFPSDRFFLYDHFGACDWTVIKERIRFLNHAHGVRVFYLDHLTALAAAEEDERKALEKIMAEIGSLVKELDIWLLFVSHLTTPDGTPHEEGGRVTIRHFKGSRSIGYWSHFMFGLERDQQSDDADERQRTVLRVLKDRYTGQATGLCVPLTYDSKTGLLHEGSDPKPMFDEAETTTEF